MNRRGFLRAAGGLAVAAPVAAAAPQVGAILGGGWMGVDLAGGAGMATEGGMKLITERSLIRCVAARWDAQYPSGSRSAEQAAISNALRGLDVERASAEEVAAIIGNDSWTRIPRCDECGAKGVPVVEIGQEPDYESRTAWICARCLRSALKMVEAGDGA